MEGISRLSAIRKCHPTADQCTDTSCGANVTGALVGVEGESLDGDRSARHARGHGRVAEGQRAGQLAEVGIVGVRVGEVGVGPVRVDLDHLVGVVLQSGQDAIGVDAIGAEDPQVEGAWLALDREPNKQVRRHVGQIHNMLRDRGPSVGAMVKPKNVRTRTGNVV